MHLRTTTAPSLAVDNVRALSLRTYKELHHDLCIPETFVVPEDLEWHRACWGFALGAAADDGGSSTARTETHQWNDIVMPKLQKYYDARQAEGLLEHGEDQWEGVRFESEYTLGWAWGYTHSTGLGDILDDIIYKGHYVSGYPERVDWLKTRGIETFHEDVSCPWGHCDDDEKLHIMLCQESKINYGVSSKHYAPPYTDEFLTELAASVRKSFCEAAGVEIESKKPSTENCMLRRDALETFFDHLLKDLNDTGNLHSFDDFIYFIDEFYDQECVDDEKQESYSLEEVQDFVRLAGVDGGLYGSDGDVWQHHRDEELNITSSPGWEAEKARRTSKEGIAMLRFSEHNVPGYYGSDGGWKPLHSDA